MIGSKSVRKVRIEGGSSFCEKNFVEKGDARGGKREGAWGKEGVIQAHTNVFSTAFF